jgi:hypothetical protein
MFSIASGFTGRRPTAARFELALQRCADQPQPAQQRHRQRAMDDRLYFAVRSFGATGPRHILQYAFADDRGNVVMSSFAETAKPYRGRHDLAEEMLVAPLDPQAIDHLVSNICRDSNLVAFGRVLQAGLLPGETVHRAASVGCAWRRFLRISRQRRLAFDRHQPLTLSDALTAAGLPPLESADAAMRALAIRDLWMWMDSVDLEREGA